MLSACSERSKERRIQSARAGTCPLGTTLTCHLQNSMRADSTSNNHLHSEQYYALLTSRCAQRIEGPIPQGVKVTSLRPKIVARVHRILAPTCALLHAPPARDRARWSAAQCCTLIMHVVNLLKEEGAWPPGLLRNVLLYTAIATISHALHEAALIQLIGCSSGVARFFYKHPYELDEPSAS
eukprot:6924-Heterococcus_DN1.PRE.10